MKVRTDNNAGITPTQILAEPACAPPTGVARRRLLVALAFGVAVVIPVEPGLSQIIQLVHVDVQVVANGYRVSKLTGHAVVNDKNQTIGKIDDFVIGREQGHPLFTVLQVGGFLDLGSRLVAVPYDSLVIDQNGKKIELPGASKDQLEKLAQFRYGT
jgi:sporulation protein YlmC with PRC-barrel domain